MSAEIAEVAGIIATLAASGVTVRVARGRLVVRGAGALDFAAAIGTLEGRERAVEEARALERSARRPVARRSATGPTRGMGENPAS